MEGAVVAGVVGVAGAGEAARKLTGALQFCPVNAGVGGRENEGHMCCFYVGLFAPVLETDGARF